MDWSKGYSASYYLSIIDPATWRDIERIEITGGSISRTASGLRQSADITCTLFDTTKEKWVRVWLVASQKDGVAHEALFTGLTSVPEQNYDGNRIEYPLACYSVLKPAEDVILPRGWFAPQGWLASDVIKNLLSVTPAPVETADVSPALADNIIAESGESNLSMVNKILNAVNWRMKIDGDGTIRIGPWASEVSQTFGIHNDVIQLKVALKADWFSCPNCFRAMSGDQNAVARDDDPDSMLSTVSRGREIWKEESDVRLGSDEGLDQYAKRRLAELQSFTHVVNYDRRFDPAVNVTDVVQLQYPGQGLTDKYIVSSQSITLGHGATVSEEVVR